MTTVSQPMVTPSVLIAATGVNSREVSAGDLLQKNGQSRMGRQRQP